MFNCLSRVLSAACFFVLPLLLQASSLPTSSTATIRVPADLLEMRFNSARDFADQLDHVTSSVSELFTIRGDGINTTQEALPPDARHFKSDIILTSTRLAIVSGIHERYRSGGFAVALFLLSKSPDGKWLVSDVVQQHGWGRDSEFLSAEIWDLPPFSEKHVHWGFTNGGRVHAICTDEFFILNYNEGFHLSLHAEGGCYLRPSGAFHEFEQHTDWHTSEGFLTATIRRDWGKKKQNAAGKTEWWYTSEHFNVPYRWNPQHQTFSTNRKNLFIPAVDWDAPTLGWPPEPSKSWVWKKEDTTD